MSESTAAGFQLSPRQKHLWLSGAETPAFNAIVAVLLEGTLELEALKSALHAVISRHEILRTTFERRPGMKVAVQVVQENLPPAWEEVDLRRVLPAQQNARVEELFQAEKRHKFGLDRGPVVRATLVKLGDEKHVLISSLPSLCADSATLRNLVREISEHYASQSSSEEVFQYADFSAWQNELLQQDEDEDAKTGKQYWNELLSGFVTAVKLPFEAKPHETAVFEPEAILIEVPAQIPASAANDPALFFAACWQVLLGRLTGQTGIVVGHLCDGRNHEEVAGAMGLFARALPIPYEFDGDRAFSAVMQELAKARASAYEQQDFLSLEESTQDLPASFVAEELPAKYSAGNLQFSILKQDSRSQRFHMQLRAVITTGGCMLELKYDPQYFSRSAAQRVASALTVLMNSAAQKPSASIAELDIMSPADRKQVVSDFNQTAADYARDKCIHYLFEEQAAKTPNEPALRFGELSLTYAELNARANQLAHLLRGSGVKQDVAVGLCLDRSAEMIVGLLGILKAGGAYVPLIPDNPKARLAHQLLETKAPVLITEKKFLSSLPEFSGRTLCLDRDMDAVSKQPTSNPEHINAPENTVYVIYTSGSTGVPKGVAVSHANLVNYSQFICSKLKAAGQALNFATVSTLGADLGNTSIFPSLISGGCLHVMGYETGMAGNLFGEYVKRHPVDVLKITPSHLSSLLASPEGAGLLPRKYLILGGEAASWDLVRKVQQSGKCAIINHYGPTEATVGCCTFSVAENDVSAWNAATVPIGRPIANDRIYILDQRMQPVPVGVPGELCIGGAGIVKGYLNQPQQTAERFVKDIFSQESNARLYRTGDLARFLPDGNVEFLGRIDQQVKIRGFRVEPAEIENLLKNHPAVQQTVVVPQDDKSGDKRLVAYVVASKKPAPSADELRSFLQEKLPEYMVPSAVVHLENLPLTRNGKVDVAALPSPDQVGSLTERIVIAPRNPVEEGLVEIWRQVLQLDQIGVQDNFFDLGGHSLLATQVISRVRSTFRVQLPLRSLFESPTVAGLAEQIAQVPPQESEDEEVAKLLRELEGLSDEEAERLLANELQPGADGSDSGNR
jgi:amino acid adenylation domain-containing protein